ncbi:hypothetical protein KR222_011864, partial [Zaprionus bogoriensis]
SEPMNDALEVKVSQFFMKTSYGSVQRVRRESDVTLWQKSIAYHELIDYINRTSIAVQGVLPGGYPVSDTMLKLCSMFDRFDLWLTKFRSSSPMSNMASSHARYLRSIEAYRNWSRSMLRNVFSMLEHAMPVSKCDYVGELGQYLAGSFGSQSRLDYGTGHELSFLFFLCGLFRAEVLHPEDEPAAALMLFARYLTVVRRLQSMFNLRPAGFHGPYSLDDYQFVAYLWGAAQLCYEAPFRPKQMFDPQVLAKWRTQYLLAGSIAFVADTKKGGSFATHSSHLWSIAVLSSWTQVFDGMHNMYIKDILTQFHMLRHVLFGPLMTFDPATTVDYLARIQLGHLSEQRKQ